MAGVNTPAGQAGATITEHLVAALSATWRGEVTLGHFAASRWYVTDTTDPGHDAAGGRPGAPGMAELFVGGEGLSRGARAVMATLLHEAAHRVACRRGIKDTSRQGRYHNRRFRDLGPSWASASTSTATGAGRAPDCPTTPLSSTATSLPV